MKPPLRRWIGHPLEAAAIGLVFLLLRLLPLDAASALGGRVGRAVGPRLRVSDRARGNLARALPGLAPEPVLADMWENLGRTMAEYPHLDQVLRERVEIVGLAHVHAMRDDGKPGIFWSGHLANWEVMPIVAAREGVPLTNIYRAANNPLVDRLIRWARRVNTGTLVPKGSAGARLAMAALKRGAHLGMLVDQKMNDGIPVPFFGRPAMTAPALAQLALRYDCPIVAARIERLQGARFRLTVEPPVLLPRSGDRDADVAQAMAAVNATLQAWIAERPAQWLWLHKRWPD